jgi:hypothetical protein
MEILQMSYLLNRFRRELRDLFGGIVGIVGVLYFQLRELILWQEEVFVLKNKTFSLRLFNVVNTMVACTLIK